MVLDFSDLANQAEQVLLGQLGVVVDGEELEGRRLVEVTRLAIAEERVQTVCIARDVNRRVKVVELFANDLVNPRSKLLFVTALEVVLHVALLDFEAVLAYNSLEDILELLVLLVHIEGMVRNDAFGGAGDGGFLDTLFESLLASRDLGVVVGRSIVMTPIVCFPDVDVFWQVNLASSTSGRHF